MSEQTQGKTFRVTHEDISACSDADTLNGWISEARVIAADIKAQIEAERELGTADEDWEHRASTAFVVAKRTISVCQNRLRTIGFYDPPEIERLGKQIAIHCKKISRQRKIIAELQAELAALKATQQ